MKILEIMLLTLFGPLLVFTFVSVIYLITLVFKMFKDN